LEVYQQPAINNQQPAANNQRSVERG